MSGFHITQPWYEDSETFTPQPSPGGIHVQVFESEGDNFTGIYDADGNPLYRESRRIGFI